MWNEPVNWWRNMIEDARRQSMVRQLDLLSDHLLDDMGLRRDQLDLLRLRPARAAEKMAFRADHVVRPSLEGCG